MKHIRTMILLLLVVAVLLVSCDDQSNRLSKEDAEQIALATTNALSWTKAYTETFDDFAEGRLEVLALDEDMQKITWKHFNIGSAATRWAIEKAVPLEDLLDFFIPNQLIIVSGSATTSKDYKILNGSIVLRTHILEGGSDIPHGIFTVDFDITGYAAQGAINSIHVNGVDASGIYDI